MVKNNEKEIYICPMHSEVKKNQPGICPRCGMRLIKSARLKAKNKKGADYGKHAGHDVDIFKRKFLISLVLTIPIFVYSGFLEKIFNLKPPVFWGSDYLSLILGSIIFFYGGWIFIVGARNELKARNPGMMTLIALAILTAYMYSVFAVLVLKSENLFWELATLITIMLLGHWLEMKAVGSAQGALKELSKLIPDVAEIIKNGETKIIKLSELKIGDTVLIRPGAKIPADAVIIKGHSEVNESMITGESKPVLKSVNNEIIAGTINGDGLLEASISKIGKNTFLAGVVRLVGEAQASKSRLQILSDRAAFYLTIIAIISGTVTFFAWFLFSQKGFIFSIERLVAVLVIACPHALGLAVPLVASISTTLAARNGFLVRQRLALETARNINVVLFDKTGTLTNGEYEVEKIISTLKTFNDVNIDENKILQLGASIDNHSEHFAAKAIVKEAQKRNLKLFEVKDFKRIPGRGTEGIIDGVKVSVGGEGILKEMNVFVDEKFKSEINILSKQGKTTNYIIFNGKLAGVVVLVDLIRNESRQTINDLKNMNIKIIMITGDSENVAAYVAKELGVEEYFAKVLPWEKSEKVKILQNRGLKVAMVGDGINDAPALALADLGVAIGAGTNVAIESAGIILVKNDPRDIVKIIKLSRLTYQKMMQNIFWATGYNVFALPLAAGVLAQKGILLQPAVAALFMSLSTIIVAINAILLKKIKLI